MKLLIVDDEELTRTGVISSLDWSSLGIDEVIQADDGVHGLETAKLHKPEIILCDVRMPRMDGIELLRRLREQGSRAYVIILTAYDSFTYAQSALRLGAVDELVQVVGRLGVVGVDVGYLVVRLFVDPEVEQPDDDVAEQHARDDEEHAHRLCRAVGLERAGDHVDT